MASEYENQLDRAKFSQGMTTKQYIDYIKQVQKRGKSAVSEVIIPLPSETEDSYFSGLELLLNNNVQVRTHTLMMLCGTELGRDKAINDFSMKSKYRVIPRQFGDYFGKKIFEIDKVCISTNTMTYQNYLKILSRRNYLPKG